MNYYMVAASIMSTLSILGVFFAIGFFLFYPKTAGCLLEQKIDYIMNDINGNLQKIKELLKARP